MTQQTIGLIGTGKMGLPMTANLLKTGFGVIAFNRSKDSLSKAEELGATRAGTIAEVSSQADIILTSLTNQQSVRDVYLGDGGLVASARPGQVLIDTSTNDVALMQEIAAAADAAGASFLDAPVSGGVGGAVVATLTVMVGGNEDAFSKAEPVLRAIGTNVHHLGPVGAGTAIKLVNQLLVGVHVAAVSEALIFGQAHGASPQKILDVISTSFGGSRMLDRGIPLVQERNFAPATPVDLIRKDLGIVLDAARQADLPLDITERTLALFDEAADQGFGENDMTATILPLEKRAGFEVK